MNIEKWIEENTEWLVDEEDIQVVPVSELLELLKTHAIVPREPSLEMLANAGLLSSEYLEETEAELIYTDMIKAAENEQ